jgi:hypothetical protein
MNGFLKFFILCSRPTLSPNLRTCPSMLLAGNKLREREIYSFFSQFKNKLGKREFIFRLRKNFNIPSPACGRGQGEGNNKKHYPGNGKLA